MKTTEFRVRPVTRFNLTRFESDPENGSGSSGSIAEFDNWDEAHRVAKAMAAVTDGASYVPEGPMSVGALGSQMANLLNPLAQQQQMQEEAQRRLATSISMHGEHGRQQDEWLAQANGGPRR